MVDKLNFHFPKTAKTEQSFCDKINEVIDWVNGLVEDMQTAQQDINWNRHRVDAVIDMVNTHEKEIDKLQMKVEPEKLETYLDEAEKWVGFLCRFKDREDEKWKYGILKSVDRTGTEFPFWDDCDFEWAVCQPVKITDMEIKENNIEF